MAWCPNCSEDRPITRQIFEGLCPNCRAPKSMAHEPWCRGPVKGALDVCTFCNHAVFAKVATAEGYQRVEAAEGQGKKLKQWSQGDLAWIVAVVVLFSSALFLIMTDFGSEPRRSPTPEHYRRTVSPPRVLPAQVGIEEVEETPSLAEPPLEPWIIRRLDRLEREGKIRDALYCARLMQSKTPHPELVRRIDRLSGGPVPNPATEKKRVSTSPPRSRGRVNHGLVHQLRKGWRDEGWRYKSKAEQARAMALMVQFVRTDCPDPADQKATLDYIQAHIESW